MRPAVTKKNFIAASMRGCCSSVSAICLAIVVAACSDLTNPGGIDVAQPIQFDNPQGAVLRRNTAVAAFAVAQSQQVVFTGLVSDEMTSYQPEFEQIDALHITADNSGSTFPYANLTNARLDALRAIPTLQQYAPSPRSRVGELFAIVGLVELYFAEDMCSGVPLADVVGEIPTGGKELSRDSLLTRALAHFDSAAAYAVDSNGAIDSQLVNLTRVTKARTLLSSGQFANAASATSGVPAGFVYLNDNFDGAIQQNAAYALVQQEQVSVSDREGVNGLDFRSGQDPRVSPFEVGVASGTDTIFGESRYSAATAPIVLANGTESSLIRAEAALQAGDIAAWSDTLNALRSAFPDTSLSGHPLPPDSTVLASAATQQDVMFRERAFWLFLSGHRQGDLRRLVRQYGRRVPTVFPSGPYAGLGGTHYGSDVTYVPIGENANPIFKGCIDRNP
jgi:hypothetical protein